MFKELFNSLFFFLSLHEYLCSHCRKMDQNPIFKMESSFSVSEFRGKLNSVSGPNISPGKMKENKYNNNNNFKIDQNAIKLYRLLFKKISYPAANFHKLNLTLKCILILSKEAV